ncbi:MAG TPA: hypothetical protein VGM93_11565 [Acidimicrobiales bacterium]
MSRSHRTAREEVDDLLESLPDAFVVVPVGSMRLVAGPPGVFLVAAVADDNPDDPDDGEPTDPAPWSLRVRAFLAEHLTLVPYVHPIVVGPEGAAVTTATLVPPQLLVSVLLEGAPILSDYVLNRIRRLAAGGILLAEREAPRPVRGWHGAPALH